MSKQLAISAAFSVFAMAAFALSATQDHGQSYAAMQTGTMTQVTAPAIGQIAPAPFDLIR